MEWLVLGGSVYGVGLGVGVGVHPGQVRAGAVRVREECGVVCVCLRVRVLVCACGDVPEMCSGGDLWCSEAHNAFARARGLGAAGVGLGGDEYSAGDLKPTTSPQGGCGLGAGDGFEMHAVI